MSHYLVAHLDELIARAQSDILAAQDEISCTPPKNNTRALARSEAAMRRAVQKVETLEALRKTYSL